MSLKPHEQEVIQMYQDGATMAEVAEAFNSNSGNVYRFLKRRKIDTRPKEEACRTYNLRTDAFSPENLDEQSLYWAGFLMADGSVITNDGRNMVVMQLGRKDTAHLRAFKQFVGSDSDLMDFESGHNKPVKRFVAYSKQMVEDLGRLGILPNKSSGAKASPVAAASRHFWRGVWDGDGSANPTGVKGKYPSVSVVGSPPLIRQCKSFLVANGLETTSKIYSKKDTLYSLFFANRKASFVYQLLYKDATVYLDRKYFPELLT